MIFPTYSTPELYIRRVLLSAQRNTFRKFDQKYEPKLAFISNRGSLHILSITPMLMGLNSVKPWVNGRETLNVQNPQVFSNTKGTTFVLAASFGLQLGEIKPPGAHTNAETLLVSCEQPIVYHLGWQKLRSFSPPISRKKLYEKHNESNTKLSELSISVSPNGQFVIGQFSNQRKYELWSWNLSTDRKLMIKSGPWHRKFHVPKISFHWTRSGFFWSPREGGPEYFSSLSGSTKEVLRRAPFLLEPEKGICFYLTHKIKSDRVTNDPWVLDVASHVQIKKSSITPSNEIVLGKTIFRSKFWVYPNMKEFSIDEVAGPYFSIMGNLLKNYIIDVDTCKITKYGYDFLSGLSYHWSVLADDEPVLFHGEVRIRSHKLYFPRFESIPHAKESRNEFVLTEDSKSPLAGYQTLFVSSENRGFGFFDELEGTEQNTIDGYRDAHPHSYPCSSNHWSDFPINDEHNAKSEPSSVQ